MPTTKLLERVKLRCAAYGFDLTATCALSDYLKRVPSDYAIGHGFAPDSTVMLIAHTKALWPAFKAAIAQDPSIAQRPHPLDSWSFEVLHDAILPIAHHPHELRFSFLGGDRRFAAIKLALACGIVEEGPAGLAVHPEHGTWFGIRAALVVPTVHPSVQSSVKVCSHCELKPCRDALQHAMFQTQLAQREGRKPDWKTWVHVRDACPVGQDQRYGDEQILWHYAHDRRALR